jgi:MFS family permease
MSAQAAEPRTSSTRRVLPLLAATGISVTGDGAFLAAAPLLAATITRDPIAVSTVTAGFYVPWLLFGLPAGALVDRWSRRRVMVVADLVRFAVLAGLAASIATGYVSVALLVAAVTVVGVAQCFFDPAAQAIIPAVVGREKEALAQVNGRYWALDTVGRSLLGPPLGSASFAIGRALPFAADALSFLASAALVRLLPEVPAANGPHESVGAAVRAGMRHLLRTRDLRVLAISMGGYNGAFNVAMAPFVLYATDILHVPSAAYGALLAASAVGGVIAGWRAAPLTRRLSYRKTMTVAHLTQAFAWAGIATVGNVWAAAALLTVLGAGSSLSSVAVGSARQALTPDALLGRVVSAFRLFGLGAAGLGALIGGIVARSFGLVAPLWVAAGILAVAGLLTWPYRRR